MVLQSLRLRLREELARELETSILPWWIACRDPAGGWPGTIDPDGSASPGAPKGVVMHARFLWTYARAYARSPQSRWLEAARHAYAFLTGPLRDRVYGGFHWGIDADGRPLTPLKVVYGQAFALYALSEWHAASGDAEAGALAAELFGLLERHAADPRHGGYPEALSQDWSRVVPNALGNEDAVCAKSMNTNLHVLEAYSAYLRATGDPRAREALRRLIDVHFDRILLPAGHFGLYFDEAWTCLNPEVASHGHDIEAAWLLAEAMGYCGLPLEARRGAIMSIAEQTLVLLGRHDGSLPNETHGSVVDGSRIWWVQAETMVGLAMAWQLSGEPRWLEALAGVWDYIGTSIKDPAGGEWHWGRNADGSLMADKPKGGFWKTSYHNGRACMEVVDRLASARHQACMTKEIL